MNRYPQLAGRRRADGAGTVPDSFVREQADISLDPLAATLEGLKTRVLSDAGPIPGCLEVDRRQMDLLKAFSAGRNPIEQLAAVLRPDPQFFMGIPLRVRDTVLEEGKGPEEACRDAHESRAHARVSPEAAEAPQHQDAPPTTGGMMANEKPPLCVNCQHYREFGPPIYRRVVCSRSAVEAVDPVHGRKVLNGATSPTYERLELPLTDPESKFRCGIEGKFFEQKVNFWGRLFR